MDDAADFKERFRKARLKRTQERGPLASKKQGRFKRVIREAPLEFPRPENPSNPAEVNRDVSETSAVSTLSKEEMDRILMPPPGPLKKKPRPSTKEDPKPPTHLMEEPAHVTKRDVEMQPSDEKGIPEDFFEVERKKAQEQLEKERTAQRTDAELARFQNEVEDSLVSLSAKEAQEKEDSDLHRQETEQYEQRRRLQLVQQFKEKRQHQPLPTSGSTASPSSLEEASMETESQSDEEEDVEVQWRGKAI